MRNKVVYRVKQQELEEREINIQERTGNSNIN